MKQQYRVFAGMRLRTGGRTDSWLAMLGALLMIGASSILSARLLLDAVAGIGLTDDAPEYFVSLSLPIRF